MNKPRRKSPIYILAAEDSSVSQSALSGGSRGPPEQEEDDFGICHSCGRPRDFPERSNYSERLEPVNDYVDRSLDRRSMVGGGFDMDLEAQWDNLDYSLNGGLGFAGHECTIDEVCSRYPNRSYSFADDFHRIMYPYYTRNRSDRHYSKRVPLRAYVANLRKTRRGRYEPQMDMKPRHPWSDPTSAGAQRSSGLRNSYSVRRRGGIHPRPVTEASYRSYPPEYFRACYPGPVKAEGVQVGIQREDRFPPQDAILTIGPRTSWQCAEEMGSQVHRLEHNVDQHLENGTYTNERSTMVEEVRGDGGQCSRLSRECQKPPSVSWKVVELEKQDECAVSIRNNPVSTKKQKKYEKSRRDDTNDQQPCSVFTCPQCMNEIEEHKTNLPCCCARHCKRHRNYNSTAS
ncbi:unnamed protein product [Calicophoron daubneyi]|uniref:Uncharacterized protein n=1 Tax=Calicophoron daubneyi TaxID=300641 RepID=A0AAV2TQX8_CALDB